ncbi:MAG: hypothetical protein KDH20_14975 [Rhodocyclaceae bacterium]|nr:hypothetical protein [Rhodocyclaceae bacterium]
MDDRKHFERIAREISGEGLQQGLWQQALKDAGGNHDQARVLYIRARHDQLAAADRAPAPTLALVDAPPRQSAGTAGGGSRAVGDDDASPALRRLRSELAAALASAGKGSLYAALGLSPECSDNDIRRRIADLAEQGADREADKRYAIESLGKPDAREAYDRRLMDQLRGTSPAPEAAAPAAEVSLPAFDDDSVRSRRYVAIAIGIAIIAGAYVAAQWGVKAQIDAADAAAIEQSRSARDAWKAQQQANDERLQAAWARRDARDAEARQQREKKRQEELQAQAEHRRNMETLRAQRQASAQAQAQENARRSAEARRENARSAAQERDAARAAREERYWACMNRALESSDSASARANCSRLR